MRSTVVRVLPALLLLLAVGTDVAMSAGASGTAARYIVFKIQPDGSARAVFSARVRMRGPLQGRAAGARAVTRQTDQVRVRLEDARRALVFDDTVEIPRWVRGEFHGASVGAGSFTIDGHLVPETGAAFVVRVPDVAGASLTLDSASLSQTARVDLDALEQDPTVARSAPPPQRPPLPGWSNGDPANRLDILIMGEGYTAAQQSQFDVDVLDVANNFFSITPYIEYRNYANVIGLFTASAQSGADQPPYNASCTQYARVQTCCGDPDANGVTPTTVSTAFDGTFCSFNTQRLVTVDPSLVYAAAAAEPDWDEILVLVNSTTYGGSGGAIGVFTNDFYAVEVAQHEFGHTFMHLADEYSEAYPGYPACSDVSGSSPCEANVTNQTSRPLIKWNRWIDASQPVPSSGAPPASTDAGLWEGARYLTTGMYRQGYGCIMRYLGAPFCDVAAEQYPLRLYSGGWGIPSAGVDNIEPGSESPTPGSVGAPYPGGTYSATVLGPEMGPNLTVDWLVDGMLVDTQSLATGDTASHDLIASPGVHTLELRVTDTSAIIHPTLQANFTSSRTWTVTVGPNPCGNSTLDPGETCDDADSSGGDGCSATCQIELCWQCSGLPSTCTPDDGASCTNGDPCVVGETCSGTSCGGGTAAGCMGGDGCCPAGCTTLDDGDCAATPTPTRTVTPTPTRTPTPSRTPTPTPTADCNSAAPIPASGGTFTGTTSGSSFFSGLCGGGAAPEALFAWTPDSSGTAAIFTCGAGTNFDTVLSVRSGGCAGPEVACNDDSPLNCTGSASRVTLNVIAGQTYVIFVDGYFGGSSGNFALTVMPPGTVTTDVSGKQLLVKDNPVQTKRKIVFQSKSPSIDTSSSGIDPVANGATLQVYNANGSGESACFSLPSGGWSASGLPSSPSYKYKDATFANGPCKIAAVKHGKLLKLVCEAKAQPIAYSLDEPTQGAIAVRFKSGSGIYCATFGGIVKKDSGTDPPIAGGKGQFSAKDAPPPVICPTPPVPCP